MGGNLQIMEGCQHSGQKRLGKNFWEWGPHPLKFTEAERGLADLKVLTCKRLPEKKGPRETVFGGG